MERGKPSHISHMRPVPVWNCPPWACSPAATHGSHTLQPPGMKRPISAACFITEEHEPWSTLFYIQSLSVFLLSQKQFDGFRGLLQHGGTEAALHRPPLLCPQHSNARVQTAGADQQRPTCQGKSKCSFLLGETSAALAAPAVRDTKCPAPAPAMLQERLWQSCRAPHLP